MKIKNIHQFSAGFNPGDAISNEMLAIQKYFFSLGIKGNLYSENIGSDKKICKKFRSFSGKNSDLIIYHHSIHSNVLDFVLKLQSPKILIYHNVTPHHFFEPYDLKLTYYLKRGREELPHLKDRFVLNFGDSKYNCAELISLNFSNVVELPIIIDFSKLSIDQAIDHKKNTCEKIIFVGRLAPNKKQDDLIRFAKVYKELFGDKFKLWILGACSLELKSYKEELIKMIDFYGLSDHVLISDFLSDDELIKHYSTADLFLSMSEHEGFCVPLVESMCFSIPILAFDSSAVRNTLGESGILFNSKDYPSIAAMANKLIRDNNLRLKVIETEKERLAQFKKNNSAKILHSEIIKQFEI